MTFFFWKSREWCFFKTPCFEKSHWYVKKRDKYFSLFSIMHVFTLILYLSILSTYLYVSPLFFITAQPPVHKKHIQKRFLFSFFLFLFLGKWRNYVNVTTGGWYRCEPGMPQHFFRYIFIYIQYDVYINIIYIYTYLFIYTSSCTNILFY